MWLAKRCWYWYSYCMWALPPPAFKYFLHSSCHGGCFNLQLLMWPDFTCFHLGTLCSQAWLLSTLATSVGEGDSLYSKGWWVANHSGLDDQYCQDCRRKSYSEGSQYLLFCRQATVEYALPCLYVRNSRSYPPKRKFDPLDTSIAERTGREAVYPSGTKKPLPQEGRTPSSSSSLKKQRPAPTVVA